MNQIIILLLTLGLSTRAPAQDPPPSPADGFELQTEADGVRVFVREESGDDLSVRVVTHADAPMARVRSTLDRAEEYAEWVHRCDGAYIVPGGEKNDFVYVSGIDMPFPFRDKQVVARVKQWTDSNGVLTREITAKPNAIPPDVDRDRLEVYSGEWVITPLAGGGVVLQCTVRTDAGSGLPGWLRKEIMTGGPAKTVANLRRRLESAR